MFSYKTNYFKSIRLYLPANPSHLYEIANNRNVEISFAKCFAIALIKVLIKISEFIGYRYKKSTLNKL